jgi:hypothetical protein
MSSRQGRRTGEGDSAGSGQIRTEKENNLVIELVGDRPKNDSPADRLARRGGEKMIKGRKNGISM